MVSNNRKADQDVLQGAEEQDDSIQMHSIITTHFELDGDFRQSLAHDFEGLSSCSPKNKETAY